ncbi:hypothetical protein GCM10020331_005010 [Ectobacillus funiculus]
MQHRSLKQQYPSKKRVPQIKMDITVFGMDPTSFVAPAVKQGQSLHTDELNEAVVSEGLKANGVEIGDVLKK